MPFLKGTQITLLGHCGGDKFSLPSVFSTWLSRASSLFYKNDIQPGLFQFVSWPRMSLWGEGVVLCRGAPGSPSQGNFSPPPPNSLFLYRLGKPRCLLCFSSVRTESRKSGTQQERAPAGQGQADPTLRGDRLWLWPGGCGQGSGAEAGTMPRTSLWKCTWVFQTLPGGVSTGRVKQWKISGPV